MSWKHPAIAKASTDQRDHNTRLLLSHNARMILKPTQEIFPRNTQPGSARYHKTSCRLGITARNPPARVRWGGAELCGRIYLWCVACFSMLAATLGYNIRPSYGALHRQIKSAESFRWDAVITLITARNVWLANEETHGDGSLAGTFITHQLRHCKDGSNITASGLPKKLPYHRIVVKLGKDELIPLKKVSKKEVLLHMW